MKNNQMFLSFPCKRESRLCPCESREPYFNENWIPASAGMTTVRRI